MTLDEIYLDVRDIYSLLISDFPFAMPIVKIDIDFCDDKYAKTNGKVIFINPNKWQFLNLKTKEGLLLRLWLHIAFLHIPRGQDKDFKIWNDACDFLVDGHIIESYLAKDIALPPGFLYDQSFSNKSAEEIYYILLDKTAEMKNDNFMLSSKQKSITVMKNFGDYKNMDESAAALSKGKDINDAAGDLMDDLVGDNFDELKQEIAAAEEYAAKIMTDIPASYTRIIADLTKGKAPWQNIISAIVKEIIYFGKDRSYAHPRKWAWQYGFALPGECGKKEPKIVVIYDTSQSITDDQIKYINGEVELILRNVKSVMVLTCDAAVHEEVKIRSIYDIIKDNKVKFKGKGGTNFVPALEAAAKYKPDLVIYFTDGLGNFGKRPARLKNILWGIINSDVKPPFGRYVKI